MKQQVSRLGTSKPMLATIIQLFEMKLKVKGIYFGIFEKLFQQDKHIVERLLSTLKVCCMHMYLSTKDNMPPDLLCWGNNVYSIQ